MRGDKETSCDGWSVVGFGARHYPGAIAEHLALGPETLKRYGNTQFPLCRLLRWRA